MASASQRMVFHDPPLVEIAAEIRWWPQVGEQASGSFGHAAPVPIEPVTHELQFMTFAARAGAKGFSLVERVIPPGFPMFVNQVAFRYRNPNASIGAPVFQLGPGIFSVGMVPPYKSWDSFLPYIDQGIGLLIDSWPESVGKRLSSVRLRYVDAFTDRFRDGKPTSRFLSENLGINVALPRSLMQFCTKPDAIKHALTMSMPIDGGSLELKVNDGRIRNEPALLMQTSVTRELPNSFEKDAVVAAFDSAHTVIHDAFVGMTESLHSKMQPEGSD